MKVMIDRNREIEVLNAWNYPKYLESQLDSNGGYTIEGQVNGQEGSILVPFSDIKYINGKSNMFLIGELEIREEDVLKELRIDTNGKNYFTRKQIEEIVTAPIDYDDIERILNITSMDVINNFKRVIIKLLNDGYEISNTIKDYVEAREWELKNKRIKSSLPINKPKNYKKENNKDEVFNDNVETAIVDSNKTEEVKATKSTKKNSPKSKDK